MNTTTNNNTPAINFNKIEISGQVSKQDFLREAEKFWNERASHEDKMNKVVAETAGKIWEEEKDKKFLKVSQLSRGILAAMGNRLFTDDDQADMDERVKALFSSNEKYTRVHAGRYAGIHRNDRYSAEELADLQKSSAE